MSLTCHFRRLRLNILRVLQSGSHDGDFDKLVQMGSNFCNDIRDKLWSKLVQQGQEGLEHERSDLLLSHFRNPPGAPNAKSAQSIMQWPELRWFLLIHPDPRRRSPDQQGQECMDSCKECMMDKLSCTYRSRQQTNNAVFLVIFDLSGASQ